MLDRAGMAERERFAAGKSANMPAARLLAPWHWHALILSTLVKLLLVPTYHSTDFEVHRHWLATTYTLPVSQWYFDETSQWTLDYPPFFAYFSWLLSLPAAIWDKRIVDLHAGLEYADWSCKLYMRLTVITTEVVLALALFALSRPAKDAARAKYTLPPWVATALLLHPGLVFVDHIHFQYNGFLYGVLLWSIWAAREQRPLLCAFLFSTLLNFKHIYIYIAPAFFVYLLRTYVLRGSTGTTSSSPSAAGERLFTLGFITLLPFALSVGPLAFSGLTSKAPAGPFGILAQMLRRLFPFSRGLNHAYWAANAWALYTFADRVLVKVFKMARIGSATTGAAAGTRGIIGDVEFAVLPQISAGHCFLITVLCTLIFMARLWTRPTYSAFVQSIALFGLTSFMWGFHVHEKAILLGIIPLTLLCSTSYTLMRKTLLLTIAGTVGLFPLLYEGREIPIKILYSALWLLATPFASALSIGFASQYPLQPSPTNTELLIHAAENAYLYGFFALEFFVEVVHPIWMSRVSASSPIMAGPLRGVMGGSGVRAASAAASAATSIPSTLLQSASEYVVQVVEAATDIFSSSSDDAVSSASSVASAVASKASSVASAAACTITMGALVPPAPFKTASLPAAAAYEFLPLMLTSVYCALGVTWVWLSLGARFVYGQETHDDDDDDTVAPRPPSEKLASSLHK